MKIFKISFLACFFAFNLNAADKAGDDTYVFEAKGEFAKELKSLIEKHSKDENVTVNIYKNTPNAKGNIISGGTKINRNINYIKGNLRCQLCFLPRLRRTEARLWQLS